MMWLALISLALAALPAALAAANLAILRRPAPTPAATRLVSILIPARDEAAVIGAAVRAALVSRFVPVEVLVGDDHSTDETAAIVAKIAAADARLRLVPIPPLPSGWTGKNHACAQLAALAQGDRLLFVDADVTLEPDAAAALAAHSERRGAALVSGVPRQQMGSLGECLTVPIINFLLLGYLPIAMMRMRSSPSLAAACGQLVMVEEEAYRAVGGHGAMRGSLHDGLRLPRLLRESGYRTDLVAAQALATCRMYPGLREAWAGFSKNATEGMASPIALPVWTLLLLGGHVLPWLLLGIALGVGFDSSVVLTALVAGLVSLATRTAITYASAEPLATIPMHPLAILTALAIQWTALIRKLRGGMPAPWKGRSYPAAREAGQP